MNEFERQNCLRILSTMDKNDEVGVSELDDLLSRADHAAGNAISALRELRNIFICVESFEYAHMLDAQIASIDGAVNVFRASRLK